MRWVIFATAMSVAASGSASLRALYGVAMGGEWGLGAALTMESVPPERRGFIGGMLAAWSLAGRPGRGGI